MPDILVTIRLFQGCSHRNLRKQLFAHYPTPDDEPFLSALRWVARVARSHELESWPHTGKQLMTPPGEPIVISEDITYQKISKLCKIHT